MEWSKIKNIILLILVGLNAILLVMLAQREWASAHYREEARLGALEVLSQNGVTMDPEALPPESTLRTMTAEREREAEAAMAEALLSGAGKTDDRGRDTYAGERGEGWFRLDGSFGFTFEAGSWAGEGPGSAEQGRSLLTAAGYPCEVTSQESDGETLRVTLRQTWEGAPLFNCTAVLVYEGGELRRIEDAVRLVGTPESTADSAGMNVAAVLLHFLSGVREGGWLPSQIQSMTAGYTVTHETSGRSRLTPVWELETDVGTFYVDGGTGSVHAGT